MLFRSAIVINKADAVVTVTGYTGVYDANAHGATGSATGVAGDPSASGSSLNLGASFTDVPGGIANWTFTGGTNYNDQSGDVAISISQRPITITAHAKVKTYGNVDPYLTFTAVNVANNELPTGTLVRNPGENVGVYAINQGSLTYGNNYSETYIGSVLTINSLPIIASAVAKTKVYATADPLLTFVSNPVVGAALPNGIPVSFTGSLNRDLGETVGAYAIRQNTVANTNYAITYVGANLTITPAPVVSSVVVTVSPTQYSDKVSFTATIAGGAPRLPAGPQAAQSVTFKIGTQVMGSAHLTVSGSDIVASLPNVSLLETVAAQLAPGNRIVTAVINNIDPNFGLSSSQPTTPLTITQENSSVVYSGLSYFSTASATSNAANITLLATVTDINDGNRGDIRNARVTFHQGSVSGPILGAANIPVQLVNALDLTVGTVSTNFTHTLNATEFANKGTTLDIYAEITNYYAGNNNGFPGSVTISVPGADAVTGGGFLVMSSSAGTYAGTTGTKSNFGFTMKFNKNGGSAKGQANIIVRSNNRTYQVKSNAINSLSTSGTQANFSTKANLTDITDPLAPISLGGNLDLFVDMNDVAQGGQTDEVSFRLLNGSTLLYSSNWTGTTTTRKALGGGNISVKNAVTGSSARVAADSSPDQAVEQKEFAAYPNPFNDQITFQFDNQDIESMPQV